MKDIRDFWCTQLVTDIRAAFSGFTQNRVRNSVTTCHGLRPRIPALLHLPAPSGSGSPTPLPLPLAAGFPGLLLGTVFCKRSRERVSPCPRMESERKNTKKYRNKSHTIVDAHFVCGFVTDFRTEFGVKNFSMGQIFKIFEDFLYSHKTNKSVCFLC